MSAKDGSSGGSSTDTCTSKTQKPSCFPLDHFMSGLPQKGPLGKVFSLQAMHLANDFIEIFRGIKCLLPSLCSAGDQTQNFMHARQVLNQLSHVLLFEFLPGSLSQCLTSALLGLPFRT